MVEINVESTSLLLSTFSAPVVFTNNTFNNYIGFDQSIRGYVDQNQSPTVVLSVFNGTFLGTTLNTDVPIVTVSGYLLDCNAAPCAAIANC